MGAAGRHRPVMDPLSRSHVEVHRRPRRYEEKGSGEGVNEPAVTHQEGGGGSDPPNMTQQLSDDTFTEFYRRDWTSC